MKIIDDNMIFGLDIGTRSIVGIVGHETKTGFHVVAAHIELHETRAMIDGQIHDIEEVAKTILKVKIALEEKIKRQLKKVCIAAAGRVLKTMQVTVVTEIEDHIEITKEMILSLELQGMEKAMHQINYQHHEENQPFYCVGYSVTNYYLNGFTMQNLEGHKGTSISADVLSTFLPSEVVNSLYKVIESTGLEVYSLTLEPIAAINVAIPTSYRLLNIALIDIGAGTSDIAITKAGSIIAYGMISYAGDEITESIVHEYLVDFKTAEKIKIKASGRSKSVSFKDAIGIKQTIDLDLVRQTMSLAKDALAQKIADGIIELNGGTSTNAVFIVGGGGQVTDFTPLLAKYLNLPETRVALRGKDVLANITSDDSSFKKKPEFVTPVGICLTGFENNQHDFVEVYLNDETIRIFNTNRLTVMDVVALKGIDPKTLIAKRGQSMSYTLNDKLIHVKGELGEPAHIYINQKEVDLARPIKMHDYINIVPAINGEKANIKLKNIANNIGHVFLNNEKKIFEKKVLVNGSIKNQHMSIEDQDVIQVLSPSLEEMSKSFGFEKEIVFVNEKEVSKDYIVQDNDKIYTFMEEKSDDTNQDIELKTKDNHGDHDKQTITKGITIAVSINGTNLRLTGKSDYLFVDIFDFYEFDRTKVHGTLISTINGENASYMEAIQSGDVIELYWK